MHGVMWARRVWTPPMHGVVWAAFLCTGWCGRAGCGPPSYARGGVGAQGVDTPPMHEVVWERRVLARPRIREMVGGVCAGCEHTPMRGVVGA